MDHEPFRAFAQSTCYRSRSMKAKQKLLLVQIAMCIMLMESYLAIGFLSMFLCNLSVLSLGARLESEFIPLSRLNVLVEGLKRKETRTHKPLTLENS